MSPKKLIERNVDTKQSTVLHGHFIIYYFSFFVMTSLFLCVFSLFGHRNKGTTAA